MSKRRIFCRMQIRNAVVDVFLDVMDLTASLTATTTPSGIRGLGDLNWGSHICQWYFKRDDLTDTLVPYFKAGLKNKERCIWLTAAPYDAVDARHDIEKAVPGLDRMISDGRLRIFDAGDGYVNGNSIAGVNVVEHWLNEEREALAAGCSGLRIASNTSFVADDVWQTFMEYENAFNREMSRRHRIVALCNYNVLDVQPKKMLQAVHRHQATIQQTGAEWKALTL